MAEPQSKTDKIIFVPSAFKHKLTQADIETAIGTKIYEGSLTGEPDVYAYIGFDTTANPIEVFYNIIDSETIKVFHAMPLRPEILKQIEP
ncbi:MAG: hypothetical protein LBK44_07190 [Spirochaetales bacterium]|jgi:hypothetical protein|nr:hypothetical protein [Spirochaetales bacterium]